MLRIALRQTIPLARRSILPTIAVLRASASPALPRARFESNTAASHPPAKPLPSWWKPTAVSYEEVKRRSQEPTEDAYLIDVREADEIAQGSIPSAVSLPLSTLPSSLVLKPDEFFLKHAFLKPKRDQEIIFYCRSGKRSTTACEIAEKHGFTNIKNYEGSWLDWVARERGPSS
ncbi:hypothetical protein M422DRAFT_29649 [Sphaerobolus stellatus SS14]|uniref:Rhodanese domain-containing protein n=1 Tax=Sphaerobolus stellatus (strain SS14) TaxID=990650 RepID=A0A0C9URL6_SPHS4|nr:hypothetical protein M422DRAFT_29649 [Sphaerobolus stellatus SS14]